MSEGAYIRDIHSLEELNNMICFTGESMANIEENVSNYLNGVKEVLDQQLEMIREKLEEAKEWLSEAQDALSSCEASQSYDEETGEYCPSCSSEEREVERAQREVEEWQKKYDEGKKIVDECQGELDDYYYPGSPLSPPGGHHLIRIMSERQTPKATQQLQDYIADVYEYKQHDVGGEPDSTIDSNPFIKEDDVPLTEDDKSIEFKNNIQNIKDEQEADSYRNDIKDANRVMRCPSCGRPPQLCICQNRHVDVNLYQ